MIFWDELPVGWRGQILQEHDPSRARWAYLVRRNLGHLSCEPKIFGGKDSDEFPRPLGPKRPGKFSGLSARVFLAKFSNTCWSLIDTNDGVKVGATYEATDEKIAKVDGFISATGETADVRKATYEESEGWYAGITADMFG